MREWVLVVMGVSIIAVFSQILLQNGKTANTVKKKRNRPSYRRNNYSLADAYQKRV